MENTGAKKEANFNSVTRYKKFFSFSLFIRVHLDSKPPQSSNNYKAGKNMLVKNYVEIKKQHLLPILKPLKSDVYQ